MSIQFQGALYRNASEAHDACAAAWLSADGMNGKREIQETLAEQTDEELAAECEEAWGMAIPYDDDENDEWYDREYLAAAFAEIRADPAAAFGWEDESE